MMLIKNNASSAWVLPLGAIWLGRSALGAWRSMLRRLSPAPTGITITQIQKKQQYTNFIYLYISITLMHSMVDYSLNNLYKI